MRILRSLIAFSLALSNVAFALTCVGAGTVALVPRPRRLAVDAGELVIRAETIDRSVATFAEDPSLPREGYRLTVGKDGVRIVSAGRGGAVYALETLKQLVRPGGERGTWRVPFVTIEDAPKYAWRGLLIDEGRHFFGKDGVKRILRTMAQHKLNVLHWHLTEDGGWRLDVPGLPELAKYGAVRTASPAYGEVGTEDKDGWHGRLVRETYGPFFYTESDVREIVAYAAERNIDILPEVDLPGHVCAFLAAYPRFACRPENFAARTPRAEWGIARDVLCVGNPEAIACFDRIFDYVTDVFPFPFVHIGGDECPRERWKSCPKCQAFMKANGMKDESELQRWVLRHVASRLAGKGRRIVGWDECFDGPVPENMVGMFRYIDGPPKGWHFSACREIAATGRDVIAAPWQSCYHDYAQGLKEDPFAYISNRPCTLEDAYFDIAATVPSEQAKHLLGSESCCWGEYTWYLPDLEWKTWPRACATAEVLWSGRGDFEDFYRRMEIHRKRLVAQGINCAPLTRR